MVDSKEHRSVDALKRIHSRKQTHNGIEFEQLLKECTAHK